jgi:penicillin-binding protein 1B
VFGALALSNGLRRALAFAGWGFLVASVVCGVWLFSTYSHWAGVLDQQLAGSSLRRPAGLYARPRQLSSGQKITRDQLIERLRRAGYGEGAGTTEFASGSFAPVLEGLEVSTNDFYVTPELPARLRLTLGPDAIGRIEDITNRRAVRSIQLPAELLTCDLNSKQQAHSATSFEDIPRILVDAVSAIEDRSFFSHDGIDARAIIRALVSNTKSGRIREGGSTITQQLVKNEFLSTERTLDRKIAEAMMAMALEHRLSKEQIFALYCDRTYLGQSGATGIYGFKQAARLYFGKELSGLSLGETALLAGLISAPNQYSPYRNRADALTRRDVVLSAMVETGSITESQASAAREENISLLPPQRLDKLAAPYFVDYVQRELEAINQDPQSIAHSHVQTTLDLDLQHAANEAIAKHLAALDKYYRKRSSKPEAALIALNPHSGEILAMVGGRDYGQSQLNRATDAMRQPGSVFKPVVYAAAMAEGFSPLSMWSNAPQEFDYGYRAVYRPRNYGDSYTHSEVTLREAVVRSLNVVAVEAAMRAGLGNVAAMAEKMGLEQRVAYPSMALGTAEASPMSIARAYTTFANDGVKVDPLSVRSIARGGHPDTRLEASRSRVISPQMAYIVTETLADAINRGTGARARSAGYRGPAAGKTGTARDAWFAGYTPSLLVVVWVGFDDYSPLNMTGGEAAVPIWADFVNRAMQLRPDLAADGFARPGGLFTLEIDPETGCQASEYCGRRQKISLPGYRLPPLCMVHQAPITEEEAEIDESMVEEEPAVIDPNEPPPSGEPPGHVEKLRLFMRPRDH